jgi:hypothetical protein
VSALLHDFNRIERFRGDKEKRGSQRRDKRRQTRCNYDRKSIERSCCSVIVVIEVRDLRPMVFGERWRSPIKMGMNHRGMIVIGSRSLCRVNVLKRRQQESQQQSHARL